ncbi:hypothetical protein Bhyg_06444 [Pseudolycoriella hygida]|uniref:Uncharacterized protein n=1 Tax=Pseudolycoriella hygida TaxID=35572 RepID=A0A9Q0S2Y3_9DIPT|nr:hypothetical protein Bhyg_06444 [Pseudolycoriella hygida]
MTFMIPATQQMNASFRWCFKGTLCVFNCASKRYRSNNSLGSA